MVKLFGALILIGGVCGLLLVGTHAFTAEDIRLNRQAQARALMAQMLGQDLAADQDIDANRFGDCDMWVFQRVITNGYAGPIEVLVLWRAAGAGLSLRVTRHRETPGIGDFIDHRRDSWITKLDNQQIDAIAALDNVSGATITFNAMQRAARAATNGVEEYCG